MLDVLLKKKSIPLPPTFSTVLLFSKVRFSKVTSSEEFRACSGIKFLEV